jgi:CHAT domain-containing protein/tetratricopeptide (TPR) repeat protein
MRRLVCLVAALLACAPSRERAPRPGIGDSLYTAGDYDAARQAYRRELASATPDDATLAHLLTSIALSSYHLTDLDEARREADSARSLIGTSAPEAETFRVYNALGLISWQQGRLVEADTFFRTALRAADEALDTSSVAKASANLALVLTDYGEFAGARTALLRAREAAHAIGNARVEGNTYTNLAMLSLRTGDLPEAEAYVERALAVYHDARYETGTQNALGQLATIEAAKGDGQAAFAAVDSALQIARRLGLKQEVASDLQVMGDLYADAGDLSSASLYYDQAERAFMAAGIELEAANLMRGRAALDAAHGDTAAAQRHAAAALAIHRRLGARAEETNDLLSIADIAPVTDARVARDLDSADALARSSGSVAAQAQARLARARYEERRARPREVLRVLSGLATTERASLWQGAALRLRAWARLGRLDSAEVAGREAVRLVERSRGSYSSAALRTAFAARMAQVYTDLVLLLLRKGDVGGAFEVADAARGRALVEHLASARTQMAANTAPASFVDAELLGRRIDSLVVRLESADRRHARQRGMSEESSHRDLADRLARARTEYAADMARARAGDDARLLGLATVRASRVQASLAADEALLDYLETPDTLLTFVVTRDRISVVRTAARESDVSAHARVMRGLLGARTQPSKSVPSAEALFDLLVAPAESAGALRDRKRLVIVPHEALTYLPFAALRDRRRGKALVEEFIISYLPSAAALPALRGREVVRQRTAGSLAAGKPIALAPFTRELPATAVEARRFAARMNDAVTRLGGDATERYLRAALRGGGVVHVATHAELNLRNPMFSEIRLAPGTGVRDDDGRLEVYEIFGMRVHNPLVFLSGCETGVGGAWSTEFQRGEDYATLARAFLYAGVRNVIATLWPIDDEGAAALADRFYAYRRETDDAEALARAQREMMHDPRYGSPYYWAGYALSGAGN